jgi:hypothetical protein
MTESPAHTEGSELSQRRRSRRAQQDRHDREGEGDSLVFLSRTQTRRHSMAWLQVWMAGLIGFVAGAAWNGRVKE